MLTEVAEKLVQNKISIKDARNASYDAMLGSFYEIAGRRQRVLPSGDQVENEFKQITSYFQQFRNSDERRWAGVLVLTFAFLALDLVEVVQQRLQEAILTAGEECPAKAKKFVVAMIDYTLEHPGCTDSQVRKNLSIFRSNFLNINF